MSKPSLFCPAFKPRARSDIIPCSPPSSSRKRKRSTKTLGVELGAARPKLESIGGDPFPGNDSSIQSAQTRCMKEGYCRGFGPPRRGNPCCVEAEESSVDECSSQAEIGISKDELGPIRLHSLFCERHSSRKKLTNDPPHTDRPHRQHLAAVSAILHRCLLEGDYLRACRAWGLLLRSEMDGHILDIRNQDRWGVGAEILLQKTSQQASDLMKVDQDSTHEDCDETISKPRHDISSQQAENYYDRLIVQYPYRKVVADAVGPLDFYPAMFGLRLFSEQHKWEDLSASSKLKNSSSKRRNTDVTKSEWRSSSPDSQASQRLWITESLGSSMACAKDLTNRLEKLLTSPPYSDDLWLRSIKGMIGVWAEDLFATPASKTAANLHDV